MYNLNCLLTQEIVSGWILNSKGWDQLEKLIITWCRETPIGRFSNCPLCPAGSVYATYNQSTLKTSVGVCDFRPSPLSSAPLLGFLVLLFTFEGLLLVVAESFCDWIWLFTLSVAVLKVSSICWIQSCKQSWIRNTA